MRLASSGARGVPLWGEGEATKPTFIYANKERFL